MPGPSRHTEVFVLEKFEGLNAAYSGTRVGHTLVSEASVGFLTTPVSELKGPVGLIHVPRAEPPENGPPYYSTALYLWRRRVGGSVLIANSYFYDFKVLHGRIETGPSGTVDAYYHWNPLDLEGPLSQEQIIHRKIFAGFEPFGDTLYYFDGANPIIRISHHLGVRRVEKDGVDPYTVLWTSYANQAGNLLAGTYLYAITSYSPKFGESSISPDNVIAVGIAERGAVVPSDEGVRVQKEIPRGYVLIRNLPWTTVDDPWITHFNIYRTRRNEQILRFVGRVPRGKESFLDNVPDEMLAEPLQLYPTSPPSAKFLATHQDRLWAVDNNDVIRYSQSGRAEIWPRLNFVAVPDYTREDSFTQLRVVHSNLYAFLKTAVLRLVGGEPTTYGFEKVRQAEGCIAPRSFVEYWGGAIYLGPRGVVIFDGVTSQKVSETLDRALLEQTGEFDLDTACGALVQDYYFLSVTTRQPYARIRSLYPRDDAAFDNSAGNNITYVLNLKTGTWGVAGTHFDLATSGGSEGTFIAPRYDGAWLEVFKLTPELPGIDDNLVDHNYLPAWEFLHQDFGYPDQAKSVERIEITYEALGGDPDGSTRTQETQFQGTLVWDPYPGYSQAAAEPATEESLNFIIEDIDSEAFRWGDDWSSGTYKYAAPRAYRAVAYVTIAASKSFSLRLKPFIPCTLQKIVFHFLLEKSK